jgi:hypothetical protein
MKAMIDLLLALKKEFIRWSVNLEITARAKERRQ